ncbi:hypothetical protein DNL40_04300 [Xylanimonas oleitrophica]|uniref:DUF2238 domain-containing protein n=1 Tax=Xylanimonas oleitrophica TaxID=2607479 RepID=A0A2W5YHH4_9MICO|nr:hypothetical protein DNL40_04300 [Xylanimonas oleitrophica]
MLVPGDVVRAVAAVSVVVGLARFGVIAGALFLLVLGGAFLARALALPTALDVGFGGTMLVAAWAAQLDWYLAISWLDLVVHAVATGLVAAVAHRLLVRLGAAPPVEGPPLDAPPVRRERRPRLGAGVLTAAAGTALATLWELGEWAGYTYLDSRIQVGYDDTVGDLAAGTAGAVVAGVLVARAGLRGARS